jgi:calcineurin-like phosphoesterase family protein
MEQQEIKMRRNKKGRTFEEVFKKHLFGRKELLLPAESRERKVFLTADHHLFHSNVLRYCPDRGELFQTVEEMNGHFLELHNQTVGADDIVIFVGDYLWKGTGGKPGYKYSPIQRFCEMKDIMKEMRGEKYLIRGNHDTFSDEEYLEAGFAGCGYYAVLPEEDGDIIVLHDPKVVIAQWYQFMKLPNRFSLGYAACRDDIENIPGRYLCGHVHLLWRRLGPFVNVGLDVWNMRPVLLEKALLAFEEPSEILVEEQIEEED